MSEVKDTVLFTPLDCGKCGVRFALDSAFIQGRRADQRTFYCPNGCPRYYPRSGDTPEAKLRIAQKELAAAKAETERVRNFNQYVQQQLTETEKTLTVTKRKATRAKNELAKVKTRVAAGVCPDCNRTFQNVAKHMATKHSQK